MSRLVYCLLCNDILEAPEEKKWGVDELRMTPSKEIVDCLAHLGKANLPTEEAKFIWETLVKFYDGVANIPDEKLAQLHWVTVAIVPEDYANITLSNIDVIENFGLDYNLNQPQLAAIAERVREDWGGKEPEDYTYYDLVALKQIICAFNKTEIEKIHPQAYKEAAASLSKLSGCTQEVLQGLAWLAMQAEAFGSPAEWSSAVFDLVGVVAAGLPPESSKQIRSAIVK